MSYLIATIGIVAFWLVGGGRRARAWQCATYAGCACPTPLDSSHDEA
jgi:hypothetical protein